MILVVVKATEIWGLGCFGDVGSSLGNSLLVQINCHLVQVESSDPTVWSTFYEPRSFGREAGFQRSIPRHW